MNQPTLNVINSVVSARLGPARVPRQSPRAVLSRNVAIHLARHFGFSQPEIGKYYQRHHTSIQHAEERIRERLATDEGLAKLVETLKQKIIEMPEPKAESKKNRLERETNITKELHREIDRLSHKLNGTATMKETMWNLRSLLDSAQESSRLDCVRVIRAAKEMISAL